LASLTSASEKLAVVGNRRALSHLCRYGKKADMYERFFDLGEKTTQLLETSPKSIKGFLTVRKNIVKYRLNMTNFANFYHYFIPKLKKIHMYHVNSDIIPYF
jgi:hypothetical protein